MSDVETRYILVKADGSLANVVHDDEDSALAQAAGHGWGVVPAYFPPLAEDEPQDEEPKPKSRQPARKAANTSVKE